MDSNNAKGEAFRISDQWHMIGANLHKDCKMADIGNICSVHTLETNNKFGLLVMINKLVQRSILGGKACTHQKKCC